MLFSLKKKSSQNILFSQKNTKMLFSLKKVEKHTILAGQGPRGAGPLFALPCGRPWNKLYVQLFPIFFRACFIFIIRKIKIFFTKYIQYCLSASFWQRFLRKGVPRGDLRPRMPQKPKLILETNYIQIQDDKGVRHKNCNQIK